MIKTELFNTFLEKNKRKEELIFMKFSLITTIVYKNGLFNII